jgi:hypothetical protein
MELCSYVTAFQKFMPPLELLELLSKRCVSGNGNISMMLKKGHCHRYLEIDLSYPKSRMGGTNN